MVIFRNIRVPGIHTFNRNKKYKIKNKKIKEKNKIKTITSIHPQNIVQIFTKALPMNKISSLKSLAATHADLSWVKRLTCDPQTDQHKPNKTSRQVLSGHYVLVRPTPLPNPTLIHVSMPLLQELGLDVNQVKSDPEFINFFTGNISEPTSATSTNATTKSTNGEWGTTWATPYALSIYGQEMYDNCPFKNGNGYGDGRAISIGEVGPLPWNNSRYEFQLKGAGTTPFCRGGDGRAVLRSSVREFLVSEAMHHLGISTTRALTLSVSQTETVSRPWYDEVHNPKMDNIPDENDPRLLRVPPEYRKMLIKQLVMQARNPTRMIEEPCAITCRVATSFLRVGHIELFSRRAKKQGGTHVEALRKIVDHMKNREYPKVADGDYITMLRETSRRFANLTSSWINVGYCQGNFNSDNCLVGGRTMDYGPFGFMERFEPLWNMWVGGGDHYGFMNQGVAGHKNFATLVESFRPLYSTESEQKMLLDVIEEHNLHRRRSMCDMWCCKLGLDLTSGDLMDDNDGVTESIVAPLLDLMEKSQGKLEKIKTVLLVYIRCCCCCCNLFKISSFFFSLFLFFSLFSSFS